MINDTIAAIATAPGRAGIGIVRVAGKLAPAIAQAVIGQALQPRQARFSQFRDAQGALIDEGIALLFAAPHSYTGEDIVELQGQGGDAVLRLVLETCLAHGARLAQPGEFTQRAFLNGKLDLAQAESVADLIDASSSEAVRSAARSLTGEFSRRVNAVAEALTNLRMFVEATLDFPDEDVEFVSAHGVADKITQLRAQLEAVLEAARQGNVLRQGLRVVLLGQPNVGKSSLLNRLAGEELAIVTPIAGTTRDSVRSQIHLDGVPLHLVDTAGLRPTEDPVEKIGIERSWREAREADIALLVVDAREGVSAQDEAILARLPAALPRMVVCNKIDLLPNGQEYSSTNQDRYDVSAKTGEGIEALKQALLRQAGWRASNEGVFMARERHLLALKQSITHAGQAQQHAAQGAALELLAEELRLSHQALAGITGEFTPDDLLGEIFSRFCIGK